METIVQQVPYSTQQVNLLKGLRHTLEKSVLRRSLTKFPPYLFPPSWKDGLSTRQCSSEKFLSLSWNNLICSTKLLHVFLLLTVTIKYSENISTQKIFLMDSLTDYKFPLTSNELAVDRKCRLLTLQLDLNQCLVCHELLTLCFYKGETKFLSSLGCVELGHSKEVAPSSVRWAN